MDSIPLVAPVPLEDALRQTTLQLQAAQAELVEIRHTQAEFLWGMSHALRSPLTSLLGFAQLMDVEVPTPTASQKSSLAHIQQAGWGLLAMIDEILDASLVGSGKLHLEMEPVSLEEVLRDCDVLVGPLARQSNARVHFSWPEQPLFVAADRIRLRQILTALLNHAVSHSGAAGVVQVSCQHAANGRLRVLFQDTSRGKSAAWLAHPHAANHIKLIVSQQLAGYMGGVVATELTVNTATTAGQASTFWLELNAAGRAT
jgi:signal transduction histidine kinase